MPFTSVTELPANPDVRVFFTGLLIVDPNPKPPNLIPGVNTCEVFVHRSAPDHCLTIEVRRKEVGRPDIILMRHVGQLNFIEPPDNITPTHGMFILVNGSDQGVRRFDPPAGCNPSPGSEGLAFAIDLERLPTQTSSVGPVHSPGGRPSILLNDAVFYTAAKTSEDFVIGLKKNNALVVEKLAPFASVIGANIYLNAGRSVVMTWVQQGLLQTLELTKPEKEGLSYEIYVVNEPLYESEGSLLPGHDELMEYFKILPGAGERFELEIPPSNPSLPPLERGSTKTPCMAVIKGG
jgi:hypothetical protein